MSLRALLHLLSDGRWWIAAGLLVGVAGGLLSVQSATPVYSATTTLYLAAIEGGGEPGQAYQGSQLAEQKARAYAELMGGERILLEVGSDLGRTVPSGSVTAQASAGSAILTVEGRASSPALAMRIANLAAEKCANLVSELEAPRDQTLSTVLTARIVTPASRPDVPVAPDLPTSLVFGAVLGMAAGVGVTVLRRQFDSSVHGAADLEALVPVPVLGVVPRVRRRARIRWRADTSHVLAVEATRHLRTNLRFSPGTPECRSLVVTSATAGEGRTSLARDLAEAFSRQDERVLLVDADLRAPQVAALMGLTPSVGLSTVLAGGCETAEAIITWADSFDVLPAGPVPADPSELLASQRAAKTWSEVTTRYDIVLIDSPPVLPFTDAVVLAARCDGVLLLVREGRTSADHVSAAFASLSRVGSAVVGTVLTMTSRSPAASGRRRRGRITRRAVPVAVRSTVPISSTEAGPVPARPVASLLALGDGRAARSTAPAPARGLRSRPGVEPARQPPATPPDGPDGPADPVDDRAEDDLPRAVVRERGEPPIDLRKQRPDDRSVARPTDDRARDAHADRSRARPGGTADGDSAAGPRSQESERTSA